MEVPVMAHFAELDANNTVLRVIVVGNDMILNEQGQESEAIGIAFCQSLFGADTIWMQTSYNGNIRKNYAGMGFTYDTQRNAFIAPMPAGGGWILDEETCQWRNPEMEAAQIGVTRV
jgi:hypothetical protein